MISAEQVKELRVRTGAGIMDCKKALREAGEDIDKAIEFLRKQGTVKATKKLGRATREGRIEIASGSDEKSAAIIEVNCETDFVARNKDFQDFVTHLAKQALGVGGCDVDKLMKSDISGQKVDDALQEMIAKVGENISLSRFQVYSCESSEKIGKYVHAGNQIGVMVKVSGEKVLEQTVRDLAMHIAAMHPLYVSEDDVPPEVALKEKDVLRGSPDLSGKPQEVMEKMVAGRYRKFLSQICLLDQVFVKDPQGKQTVGGYLKSIDPKACVMSFLRYQVGETFDS